MDAFDFLAASAQADETDTHDTQIDDDPELRTGGCTIQ